MIILYLICKSIVSLLTSHQELIHLPRISLSRKIRLPWEYFTSIPKKFSQSLLDIARANYINIALIKPLCNLLVTSCLSFLAHRYDLSVETRYLPICLQNLLLVIQQNLFIASLGFWTFNSELCQAMLPQSNHSTIIVTTVRMISTVM